jgi:hypothetical protein
MSDGNGITGYNGGLAKSNLDAFRESFEEVTRALGQTAVAFSESLSNMWASPIAVTFNSVIQSFMDVVSQGVTSVNSLINSAVYAVNSFAKSNGSSFSYGGRVGAVLGTLTPLKEISPAGIIGMQVEKVKALVDGFVNTIRGLIAKMLGIPASIAVYDQAGSIQSLYRQRITELKTKIEDAVNLIKDKINENITSEQQSVISGKAASQAVLSA